MAGWLKNLWNKNALQPASSDEVVKSSTFEISNEKLAKEYPVLRQGEVKPPWVEYPDIEAGRLFWREAGDHYRTKVWEPYFTSLCPAAQDEYRTYWQMPEDWRTWYELLNDPHFMNADNPEIT